MSDTAATATNNPADEDSRATLGADAGGEVNDRGTSAAGDGEGQVSPEDGGGDDAQHDTSNRREEGKTDDGARGGDNLGDDGEGSSAGASERDPAQDGDEEALVVVGLAASDVKNIILQVLSPYFDDDGGGDAGEAVRPTDMATTMGAEEGGGADSADAGAGRATEVDSAMAAAAEAAAGGGSGAGGLDDEDEDTAQRYDHIKAKSWIQLICDGITERLVAMGKPYKFVTHIVVMRKCGAGMHVCSSNFYSQTDGWLSHAHDLSPHIYAVVTVYWMAI